MRYTPDYHHDPAPSPEHARAARAVAAVARAPGCPLEPRVRAPLERRLGHDLGRVRVVTGAEGERAAGAIGAHAFALGERVVFGAGRFAPETPAGRRLLAHELAHVAQQARGAVATPDAAPALEADAERRAERALVGAPARGLLQSLAPPARPQLQPYAVPGHLRCNQLADWLNANSPYAPEWAETRCSYAFDGGVQTRSTTLRSGRVQVTARGHRGITASADCPIDRPEWEPGERPNRAAELAAWNAMRRTLDAHEARHHRIGERWRGILEGRYRAINFTVTGADEADAQAQAADRVAALEAQWQADAQAAQDTIDPFRDAHIECP